MILAVDVDYQNNIANIAGVAFSSWQDTEPTAIYSSTLTGIEKYEPGAFYQRELPCILKLLHEHTLTPDCIVIDGFVYLDDQYNPGLGKHLYNSLEGKSKIIGVAKRPFINTPEACEIHRGQSRKPLFITSVGIPLALAKEHIASMHGEYRIPDLLKRADQVCRSARGDNASKEKAPGGLKVPMGFEHGHTSPFMTLAILILIGVIAYFAFDAINPEDPATLSLSSLYSTWLGWSWWAKGLSIIGPIVLLLVGSKLDNSSGLGRLPSDDDE